jgi:Flp pilus assembly protein TadG
MKLDKISSFTREVSGSALVEATILLPLLMALFGGVYEFGFYFYREQLITTGVRDAARYLALSCDPTSSSTQTDAKNLAVTGSPDGGTARVPGWDSGSINVTVSFVHDNNDSYQSTTSSCLRTVGASILIVTVSTRFSEPSLGFLDLIGLKSLGINVSHQERWVGGSALG